MDVSKEKVLTPSYKIVIVDDDEDLLKMMNYVFHSKGVEVKNFVTGKQAIDFFSDKSNVFQTDLIVLDRMLPDMDGLDILHYLVKNYDNISIPMVLILSILASEKDLMSGLEAGAVDYLPKPFNLNILLDKSLALLSKRKRL